MKLSVIVPVYNCKDHLERCVGSILKQSFADYEIILVDDGSTDGSAQLADSLAANNPQVQVIHQENQGVSIARNMGLLEAQGEYIMFVDADDYLLPNTANVFENEKLADLTCLSFEVGNNSKKITNDQLYQASESEKAKVMMIENPTQYMTVWSKFFKRKIIEENNLRFNTTLRVAEDGDFMIKYLLCANSIQFFMEVCYHYSNDTKSVMSTFDHKSNDYLNALMSSQRSIVNQNVAFQKAFAVYVLMHLNIIMVHETFATDNPLKYSVRMKRLKEMIKEPIFAEALATVKVSDCHGMRMMPVLLLKLHCNHLASILFIMRAKQNESHTK